MLKTLLILILSSSIFAQITPISTVTTVPVSGINVTPTLFFGGVIATLSNVPDQTGGAIIYRVSGVDHYLGQPSNPLSIYSPYLFVDPVLINQFTVSILPIQDLIIAGVSLPPGFQFYVQYVQIDMGGGLTCSDLVILTI